MKTRIIGILAIITLILAIAVFIALYNQARTDNPTYNNSRSNSGEMSSVDGTKIEQDIYEFDEENFEFSSETNIILSDGDIKVDGSNVKIDGNTVFIVAGGAYRISGTLTNGRIIVNAPKENVKIILDGVSISCDYNSPIYVYKSKATYIYLADGTVSTLTDGESYKYNDEYSNEEEEEPNAALYSKSDLIIGGKGTLNVTGVYNNGITSKDTLYITDATINVEAKNNGITGKDCLVAEDATINVTAKGDGIRSTNTKDDTLGWIKITNSNITIDAQEDGIQAETDLIINGGTFYIKTGNGASSSQKVNNDTFGRDMWGRNSKTSSSESETSMKGLKASRYITIDGNVNMNIDSADDAIHSNASLEINDGIININTADDAVHADETATINGGLVNILECYEGIEGADVVINSGDITIVASDDGLNVNGGNDNSGFGGGGNAEDFKPDDIENFNPEDMGNFNPEDMGNFKPEDMGNFNPEDMENMTPPEGFSGRQDGSSRRGSRPSADTMERPDNSSSDKTFTKPDNMPQNGQVPNNIPGTNSGKSTHKLIINGGTIIVNAKGDGLDSNGSIEMNGGEVIVNGPTDSFNSALDYDSSFTLNGGSVIAIGASGIVQGIKTTGSQGSIMKNFSSTQSANTTIEIKDKDGNIIFKMVSEKTFSSVVATSSKILSGEDYELYINGKLEETITASQDTSSQGFSGFGGFGGGRNK